MDDIIARVRKLLKKRPRLIVYFAGGLAVFIIAFYLLSSYSGLFGGEVSPHEAEPEVVDPFGLMLNYPGRENFGAENREDLELQTGAFSDLRVNPGIEWREFMGGGQALLVYQRMYRECGHLVETKETLPFSFNNLTWEDARRMFPDWQVVVVTDREVVLYKQVEGVCPNDNHLYLGIEKGRVAVYDGPPNQGGKVSWITLIYVSDLPEREVRSLEEGILVESEAELYGIIEGLASTKRD